MVTFKRIKYLFITGLVLGAGMVREIFVARYYGLSPQLDAYAAVFGFYLFFGNQIANTIESAFISKYSHVSKKVIYKRMFDAQCGLLVVLAAVCFSLYFLSDSIVNILFHFDTSQVILSSLIIKFFIPAIIFSSLIGLFRAVLNIHGIHAPGFFYGLIVSICVIISIIFLQEKINILALPVGYGLGNLIMLLFLFIYLIKIYKGNIIETIKIKKPFLIWIFAIWIFFSEVIFQCSYLAQRANASTFGDGAISAYFYAYSFLMVFSALIVQPVSTIVNPVISRKFRENSEIAYLYIKRVCIAMCLFGIIASIIMYNLSSFLLEIILVRGNFTIEDSSRTSSLLEIMVFALPFISIASVIKNSYYSKGSYKTPLYANIIRLIILLVSIHYLTNSFGIEGLAMAYVMSTGSVTTIMLIKLLTSNNNRIEYNGVK